MTYVVHILTGSRGLVAGFVALYLAKGATATGADAPDSASAQTLGVAGFFGGPIAQFMWLPMLAFEVPLGLWLLIKGVP